MHCLPAVCLFQVKTIIIMSLTNQLRADSNIVSQSSIIIISHQTIRQTDRQRDRETVDGSGTLSMRTTVCCPIIDWFNTRAQCRNASTSSS